ncbi:radical SAM protein [Streptomyces sp. NPDC050617]|uniref:radical SAM protein n=1 Tax=Streptomyces sp. NPDC050617 TaxID=3154628 RepID=UPI00344253AD
MTSLALEITGQCQNTCPLHCYARSGPTEGHGSMTREDWFTLLDQAAGLGIAAVQYIGGEPTRHPCLPQLIGHAVSLGIRVEVFSNLVHIRPSMWRAFAHAGVTLATSYYSDDAAEHEKITGGRGSYARTRANIAEAIQRGIPLRVGVIHVLDGQHTAGALAELRRLGVTGEIGVDRVRAIGNGGTTGPDIRDPAELCGHCGTDRAAVSPDGIVTPCVMSRWMVAGAVRRQPLADILTGSAWADRMAAIPRATGNCVPDTCTPKEDSCQPSPGVDPCVPKDSPCGPGKPACLPKFPHHPEA